MINLDFSFVSWDYAYKFISDGLLFSVTLTATALIGGLVLGTLLAMMRLSANRWLSWPAKIYVDFMRSIPLLMVILWFYLLIPIIVGQPLGREYSALITFTAFEAAYYSEIMRAGIQSIPKGQVGAGYALGLTYGQNMKLIILPQALRNMLPVLLTQTIILFQDTSLVHIITANDLLHSFINSGIVFGRPIESYLLAAVTYFLICFTLSQIVRRIHKATAIVR